jgi:hypothetical protein
LALPVLVAENQPASTPGYYFEGTPNDGVHGFRSYIVGVSGDGAQSPPSTVMQQLDTKHLASGSFTDDPSDATNAFLATPAIEQLRAATVIDTYAVGALDPSELCAWMGGLELPAQ